MVAPAPGSTPIPNPMIVPRTIGIVLSLRADKRDPQAEDHLRERVEALERGSA